MTSKSQCTEDKTQWLWIAVLAGATVLLSLAFACATPVAALATLAALVLPQRDGLYLIAAVWLSNQIVGFGLLNYPHTLDSYGWGLAIGVGALAAYLAARAIVDRTSALAPAVTIVAAFVSAFVAYEGILYGATFVLSGKGAFSAEVVGRIALINVAALAVLLVAHRLGASLGFVRDRVDRVQQQPI